MSRRTSRPLLFALLACVAAVSALAAPPSHAAAPRYHTKPGVRLSPLVADKVAAIAERYYAATRRPLLITSGTRSPAEQAEAMYGKLRAGDRLYLYRNQAAVTPIRDAYDRGRKRRAKPAVVIAEMTRILAEQCERGVYLSRHLRAHAFDIRSYDLSARQRRALRAAIAAVGGVTVLEEKRPPHFHCEVRAAKPASSGEVPPDAEDAPEPDEGEADASVVPGDAPPLEVDEDAADTTPAPPEASPAPPEPPPAPEEPPAPEPPAGPVSP